MSSIEDEALAAALAGLNQLTDLDRDLHAKWEAERADSARLREELASAEQHVLKAEAAEYAAIQRRKQVERAWATSVLYSNQQKGFDSTPKDLATSVAALVREHAGKPIGECELCGHRAPLIYATFVECGLKDSRLVCAWGCAEGKP